MDPRPAPSTRLFASTVCSGVHCQRRAPKMPPAIPTVSPATSRPYLSLRLSEPLPDQAISPASDPQAVLVVYHSAWEVVGRMPKRVRPQAVPPPMTAPAPPSSATTPTLSCC